MTNRVELIRKLRSPDNKYVLKAVEELRVRGWLQDGSLRNVPLCHVHIQNADLLSADFTKVDFHQADLRGADLSDANLSDAKLTRADLRGANMSRTQLVGADLYKADLYEARNLTDAQLSSVKRLYGATMPDGLPYDGRYNLAGDLDFARWARIDTENHAEMAEFFGVTLETYQHGQELAEKTPS